MIHGVGVRIVDAHRHLRILDPKLLGEGGDGVFIAGEPLEARMEQRHVSGQMPGRIAAGIDGDEGKPHALALGSQPVDCCRHGLQARRTHVRAEGVAEGEQQRAAMEVRLAHGRAGLVRQGEADAIVGLRAAEEPAPDEKQRQKDTHDHPLCFRP
ncbi:hypothetical protein [Azospirillum sp. TSO22-1]|uniref:hypothetical protein n=1 Tax=Azospirillum sp. TSO22-1 TaxID=716789 RepID=UPI000D609EA3|nr:hypothetical protein [Azospirillum sp. TSO22-1]PWC53821.1 hypothetical protein TSO221_09920 [Azospirillum sp. TSO22-1]